METQPTPSTASTVFHETDSGQMLCGDAVEVLNNDFEEDSVNLIVTSPPFGLVRKKEYGNADADEYVDWFRPFADAFRRVLREDGSLVIDIGGSWIPGKPVRSLYHFRLLIALCDEFGFNLAQEFYWWNPSKLPTPAEWVTVRRIRVKDALNCVWWLSPSEWPKASNRRVLQPYSESQLDLFEDGYQADKRPSGHNISDQFDSRNKGSIPPNLLAIANTESNSHYLRYCEENNLNVHPARFPAELPEFFIRMCTDKGDQVVDPFAGSCVTGAVCEVTDRRWTCIENDQSYLEGAMGRFQENALDDLRRDEGTSEVPSYKIFRPGFLWGEEEEPLPDDGGRNR